jgi:hypothetical protein
MDASDARRGGSKPVWLALAAAAAVVGLAITVALPSGGPAMRTSRLHSAASELRSNDTHWVTAQIAASAPLPAPAAPVGPPAPRAESNEGEGGVLRIEGREETSSEDPATAPESAEEPDARALADARQVLLEKFELLKKSDPRAAQLLLEGLVQSIAEDPDVQLLQAERSAMATLRNIASAQAQMQASGAIDVDGDGAGEYGTFAELSGGCTLRGSSKTMNPPVLSSSFRRVQRGAVERAGYFFAVYLPDASGQGLAENYEGGAHLGLFQASAADACEVAWCAYAWPVSSQLAGRVFFVNQDGDVLARENGIAGETIYAGADGPSPDAAFDATTLPGTITGRSAVDRPARDGGRWLALR